MFSTEALFLCAITSQIPAKLPEREVILEAKDMANERLPKRMIKVGKLFTMHRSLVAARFGAVKEERLPRFWTSCEHSSLPQNRA